MTSFLTILLLLTLLLPGLALLVAIVIRYLFRGSKADGPTDPLERDD